MKLLPHILIFFSITQSFAQVDLSGYVTFPDSVGIDLIRVEVWQNNQQLASTINDSLGYFEIDLILTGVEGSTVQPNEFSPYPNYPSPFDKTTNIIYEVDKPEEISITIYKSIGQKITTLAGGYTDKNDFMLLNGIEETVLTMK